MPVEPPSGGPAWVGWLLFIVTVVLFVWREIVNARNNAATREKSKIEAQKLSLDILSESAESYERQIGVIVAALEADSVPVSSQQIDALRAEWPGRPGLPRDGRQAAADHLAARATARKELPVVIDLLTAVQRRQVDLARDLSQGVLVRDEVLQDVRNKTERLADQLGDLVRLVAASPRIFIAETTPIPGITPREGDIVMLVPPGSLSAPGEGEVSPPEAETP